VTAEQWARVFRAARQNASGADADVVLRHALKAMAEECEKIAKETA